MKFVLTHSKVKEKFVLNKDPIENYFYLTFTTIQNHIGRSVIGAVIMLLKALGRAI